MFYIDVFFEPVHLTFFMLLTLECSDCRSLLLATLEVIRRGEKSVI